MKNFKDYNEFKELILLAIEEAKSKYGVELTPKRWQKIGVYQKNHYKEEVQSPEVWLYKAGQSIGKWKCGAVVTGLDLNGWGSVSELVEKHLKWL